MSLQFDERVVADLAFLATQGSETLQAFCDVSLQFINSGAERSAKVFASAAKKIGVDVSSVERGVLALSHCLLEVRHPPAH